MKSLINAHMSGPDGRTTVENHLLEVTGLYTKSLLKKTKETAETFYLLALVVSISSSCGAQLEAACPECRSWSRPSGGSLRSNSSSSS